MLCVLDSYIASDDKNQLLIAPMDDATEQIVFKWSGFSYENITSGITLALNNQEHLDIYSASQHCTVSLN
jgi:hypothetical protein